MMRGPASRHCDQIRPPSAAFRPAARLAPIGRIAEARLQARRRCSARSNLEPACILQFRRRALPDVFHSRNERNSAGMQAVEPT